MVVASYDAFRVGAFVGVVGPSGAGKDSVMAGAKALLHYQPSIIFPQRIVTRAPDAAEGNVEMSQREFDLVDASGGFALAWMAHKLSYAVPVEADAYVAQGCIVVVNISRSVVPALRRRYTRGLVAFIDAPAHIRRARICQRGREESGAVDERLAREVASFLPADADVLIDNSGSVEHAARALADYLASLMNVSVSAQSA
jgi:ribose 1,5-bisphosphokinase